MTTVPGPIRIRITGASPWLLAAATLAATALPLQPARAEIVTTDRAIARQDIDAERVRVRGFLSREDVRGQLTALGIDADEAAKRVGSMSDTEVAQIAGRIDALPAGKARRGSIVLVLLLVVLILLVI